MSKDTLWTEQDIFHFIVFVLGAIWLIMMLGPIVLLIATLGLLQK